MVPAEDDRPPPEVPEVAALREIAEAYRLDNERLRTQLTGMMLDNPDLRPLPVMSLVRNDKEYQAVLRAKKAGLIEVEKRGNGRGFLFWTEAGIAAWRKMTDRPPAK